MLRKPSCLIAAQATAGLQPVSQGNETGEATHLSGCMKIQGPGERILLNPNPPEKMIDFFIIETSQRMCM